ncbi:hypothetical protein NBRC116595_24740 [Aliiglaciecola sp. NS0011-25]
MVALTDFCVTGEGQIVVFTDEVSQCVVVDIHLGFHAEYDFYPSIRIYENGSPLKKMGFSAVY